MSRPVESLEILRWGKIRNFEHQEAAILLRRSEVSVAYKHQPLTKPSFPKPTPKGNPTYSRKVIVKVSYKHFSPKNLTQRKKFEITCNTYDSIDYFYRFDKDAGFSKSDDKVTLEQAKEIFKDDAIFKVIISPEDEEVLNQEYIRQIMNNLEKQCGKRLHWVAVFHEGDHPHAHVMISRTKSEGCSWETPLKIDSKIISEGIRKFAENLSNRILGYKTVDEYRKPFVSTIGKIGPARIDFDIAGNRKKGTNLFIPTDKEYYILDPERLHLLPKWKQLLIEKRLEFLEKNVKETGIKKIAGYWRCYNPEWLNYLLNFEKIKPFEHLEKEYGKIAVESARTVNKPFLGTVVGHTIIDDNSQKAGLVIKGEDGKLHYLEAELSYQDNSRIDGEFVEVTPNYSSFKVRKKR